MTNKKTAVIPSGTSGILLNNFKSSLDEVLSEIKASNQGEYKYFNIQHIDVLQKELQTLIDRLDSLNSSKSDSLIPSNIDHMEIIKLSLLIERLQLGIASGKTTIINAQKAAKRSIMNLFNPGWKFTDINKIIGNVKKRLDGILWNEFMLQLNDKEAKGVMIVLKNYKENKLQYNLVLDERRYIIPNLNNIKKYLERSDSILGFERIVNCYGNTATDSAELDDLYSQFLAVVKHWVVGEVKKYNISID